MEFHEKLQELRKGRGLTQEELAEALYVSRTAVSKWESGRGYPSIDSLKMISGFFSVSIDDLLSGEKLVILAQRENRTDIRRIRDLLWGMTDLMSLGLIGLPLYPRTVEGYVYSVNLWNYTETASYNRAVYWIFFLGLAAIGATEMLLAQLDARKGRKLLSVLSWILGIGAVLYLVLAREAYAAVVAIGLLLFKGLLIYKYGRT